MPSTRLRGSSSMRDARPEGAEAFGSASVAFEQLGLQHGPAEEAIRAEAHALLRESISPEELDAAILRGRATPLEIAVQRALAAAS